MSKLFSPISFRGVELKNRIVMSPMCMYSSDETGLITNWHYTHYHSRAVGGVGLIMQEATAVEPQGRISSGDLGIWSDEHIAGYRHLVELVHQQNAKIGIQLAHAGRKAEVEGDIYAPSALPFHETRRTPLEMTKADIDRVIERFGLAARRAQLANYDFIEIHAAHGYLINTFLSPLSNQRQDEYGGSKERRFLFLSKIIEAIRAEWSGPLFVRISAEEYHPEGNHVEDYVYYAQEMKNLGVDLIDCSSGALVPAAINVFPGYQVPYAETIRCEAQIPTGAVGVITTAEFAEEVISNQRADLLFLGRVLLREPYWPLHAARELGVEVELPKQYQLAYSRGRVAQNK